MVKQNVKSGRKTPFGINAFEKAIGGNKKS